MNQDFALNATPAIARRLIRMRLLNEQIKIPHQLAEIAKRDCVRYDDFDELACPHTPERAALTQFILDCNLRCIVQAPYHPVMNEVTILNAIRLSKIQPITIISNRRSAWRSAVNANFLDNEVILLAHELSNSQIDAQRPGVLIVDLHNLFLGGGTTGNRFIREFPRTILYNDVSSFSDMPHWMTLIGTLFPTMPHLSAIRDIKDNPAHYAKMPLQDFAVYYNFCLFPEYIKSPKLLEKANSLFQSPNIEASAF